MADKFKDIQINGHEFRIGLPSARDGSWMVQVILAAARNVGGAIDPNNYSKMQDILLSKCLYLRNNGDGTKIPQRLYDPQGEKTCWLVPDIGIETDTETVTLLSDEALDFCVGPTIRTLIVKAEVERQRQKELELAKDSTINQ